MTRHSFSSILLALTVPAAAALHPHAPHDEAATSPWDRANDWSIADTLFPNLHFHNAVGAASTDPEFLAAGGHAPAREAFTTQSLEPSLTLKTRYFEAFANHVFAQNAHGRWINEWEEVFGKIVNLPGGIHLRGGRFLPTIGALNDRHLHDWDFVDAEIAPARFLGADGLMLEGGELTVPFPTPLGGWNFTAHLAGGRAAAHHHAEDAHAAAIEPPHEGDESVLAGTVWTASLRARRELDSHRTLAIGLGWAQGSNALTRDSQIASIDAEYLWQEHGHAGCDHEGCGRALLLRGEILWRQAAAASFHDVDDDGIIDLTGVDTFAAGTYRELGVDAHAVFTWNPRLDTALRLAWVQGVADFGQDERLRISPVVSWWLDDSRRAGLRLQYNYDRRPGHTDAHALWLQFNLALGCTHEEH